MKVSIVGQLTEHANANIDLFGWDFDCDCCSTPHEAVRTHRQELIKMAKEAETYSYKHHETAYCGISVL